jgi:hypothetical protein
MYKLSGAYVTSENICTSKTQVRDDCGSKTLFTHLACPGSDQTDRIIANFSDKRVNISRGIKFYFDIMNLEGMIILSWYVSSKC